LTTALDVTVRKTPASRWSIRGRNGTYVYETELRSNEVAGHPVQVAAVTEGHQGKLLPEFLKHLFLSKETDADACPVVTYPRKLSQDGVGEEGADATVGILGERPESEGEDHQQNRHQSRAAHEHVREEEREERQTPDPGWRQRHLYFSPVLVNKKRSPF
jgi:hypothetical protein